MPLKPYTPHEFKVMRVRECEPMTELLDQPEKVAAYWRQNITKADWYDPMKEALVVLILNTRKRIMGHNLVSLGSLDTCSFHVREIFRPVIVAAGNCIALAHNHPSGESSPSEADIKMTRDIIRAGQLLGIEIVDHVIIGRDSHTSLRSQGYFY